MASKLLNFISPYTDFLVLDVRREARRAPDPTVVGLTYRRPVAGGQAFIAFAGWTLSFCLFLSTNIFRIQAHAHVLCVLIPSQDRNNNAAATAAVRKQVLSAPSSFRGEVCLVFKSWSVLTVAVLDRLSTPDKCGFEL